HREFEVRIDRWFRAWTNLSFESRAAVLAGAVNDQVRFADAVSFIRGRVELERHIVAARRRMPGIEMVRRGPARSCQGVALADWELRAGEQVFVEGTSVFELDADGMIAAVTGVSD